MKKFRCTVCGYVYEGDAAPEKCPLCKAPASKFVEVVEEEAVPEYSASDMDDSDDYFEDEDDDEKPKKKKRASKKKDE